MKLAYGIVVLLCALLARAAAQTATDSVEIGKNSPEAPLKVGGNVKPPRAISAPDPEYPEQARRANYEGTVVLKVVIDKEGHVRDIHVVRSLGMGLNERAIAAVQSWKFQPATKNGQPVAVQINIEVNFRLYDGAGRDTFATLLAKADAGDAKSQLKLGRKLLAAGGAPGNEIEGLAWLQRAATQGLPEAQFRMAEYLYSRAITPADYITAYIWCSRAQQHRYRHADKLLQKIAAKMSPPDIAVAEASLKRGTAITGPQPSTDAPLTPSH